MKKSKNKKRMQKLIDRIARDSAELQRLASQDGGPGNPPPGGGR